jgi:hypothetical protein
MQYIQGFNLKDSLLETVDPEEERHVLFADNFATTLRQVLEHDIIVSLEHSRRRGLVSPSFCFMGVPAKVGYTLLTCCATRTRSVMGPGERASPVNGVAVVRSQGTGRHCM